MVTQIVFFFILDKASGPGAPMAISICVDVDEFCQLISGESSHRLSQKTCQSNADLLNIVLNVKYSFPAGMLISIEIAYRICSIIRGKTT